MCLFTHFAAGALVGGVTGNVYFGAAAGFASHAVLDVIPHYDHPDWRLELGGGVLALLLLLLMPFATWPAVVGGLFGMVPDLENLFQKLGKMRRDQFIYPTHTGLLRHGRTLGPRSLVWQLAIFVGCFVALGLFNPGAASAAELDGMPTMARPRVEVLSADANRTVVRVTCDVITPAADWQTVDPLRVHWGLPLRIDDTGKAEGRDPVLLPPALLLNLAVPTREAVAWQVTGIQWWKEPAGDAVPELVRFGVPHVSRSIPLVGTELPLALDGGILRTLTIEIIHTPTGAQRTHLALAQTKAGDLPDDKVSSPARILNPDLYRALARGSREAALDKAAADKAQYEDLFALTNRWVRLQVGATGLYRVTGQNLSGYGVATTSVDPGKLRVYRGGGLPLEPNPEYADSLQLDRIGLHEVAIEVRDGGDGEWNLDDEVRFYGVATSVWLDRLDPAGERLEHYDHPYQSEAVYWLTWSDETTTDPLPGSPLRVTQTTATPTGGAQETTVRLRTHYEQQILDSGGVVQDNWMWDNAIFSSRVEPFVLREPVAGRPVRFQVDMRGIYSDFTSMQYDITASAYLNGDAANAEVINFSKAAQDDSLRVRIMGESTSVVTGTNLLTLSNDSTGPRPIGLDSFDILYWTDLDLNGGNGQLEFAHWGDQVAAPGTPTDLVLTGRAGQTPVVWDVSVPSAPTIMAGSANTNTITYGLTRDPGTDRHFIASGAGDIMSPQSGERMVPASLRSRATDYDYVVVAAAPFLTAGQRLAEFRSAEIPGVASPRATVVTVNDIYDNFAGGQKDPMAIRNYLRWLYEAGGQRLAYVCLLGNASRDYRNYRDRVPLVDLYDLVPTQVRTSFPVWPRHESRELPYAADDGLVSFDSPAVPGDVDLPDLAQGRLPALSVAEANDMVDRAVAYGRDPEPGLWRNGVLMVADDNFRPSNPGVPLLGETTHMTEAEDISENYLPLSVDLTKLYGVDYAFPPGSLVKPAMRADINASLNAGTTIYYFVGHGAEDNLADEQVFQSRDIPNLTNGMQRPLFVAFSCDVGVFDSPSRRSMAEQFLQYDSGGAAATICASQVSYSFQNNVLTEAFFSELYPGRHVDPTISVAEALRRGKGELTQAGSSGINLRHNSQRYNFFGDPAMILPNPVDDLQFAAASLDTLRAGARQTVVLAAGGKALLGAGDSYRLRVQEATWDRVFPASSTTESSFRHPGSPVFAGNGTMDAGDLVVPFKVPVQLRYGDEARVRLIVATPDGDHAAVAVIPSVRSAIGPVDDIVGPAVNLAFAENRYRVRPGEELVATLSDTSGIAMLGTNPANSLLLELDESGFLADVTSSFSYDANSYTTGRLVFPLPGDVANGRHKAALYASDALGNVGSDTLSFEVVPAGVTDIHSVTLFPNPTPGYCRLLFELSDPMAVKWDIYSLAGSRLRSITANLGAGPQIIEWDGRDGQGDEIANGTYLYVLRGNGATADDREIRKTGKLVIMR